MSKELDEAAVVYMEEGFSYETSPIEHFKAGALWAEKHSPKVLALVEALEKIADPRLRDHKEPDKYTEVGCMIHMAEVALANFRGGEPPAGGEGR